MAGQTPRSPRKPFVGTHAVKPVRSVQMARLVMGLMLVGVAPLAYWQSPMWLLVAAGISIFLMFLRL